ncbi:HalOD1 output domain-containing protein [Haloplanus sp.]|uniref:HalOD1 output domain-containing protein n=1 Tax=Haloplanus sp. TaxID=1961696 RepID=UPI00261660D7|nr:HalOD1 output domain-containing protein [Haloplanus sp.]
MERTARRDDEPPADTRPADDRRGPDDSVVGSELTDAAFVDGFDERDGQYRLTYDATRAAPSFAVVSVVSTVTGVDPLELDPLYESIDGDALDALFPADCPSGNRVTFQYSGCEITVRSGDVIEVTPG